MILNGYCFTKKGTHSSPTPLATINEITEFIQENVDQHYEIRIVNPEDDCTAMHIVDQTLMFPLPEGLDKENKWNPVEKKFAPVSKIILRG